MFDVRAYQNSAKDHVLRKQVFIVICIYSNKTKALIELFSRIA